jgi:lipopolysaccharide/colanic/teichoic acid biosynthesis glycosyltransferase
MIRIFDILFSLAGIILLLPIFLIISLIILLDSPGGVFFFQKRVGKGGREFRLVKFRSMVTNAENHGGLTLGARDRRITRSGYFIRKHKLDELPQLFNVLAGDMSLVGPRPDLKKYTDLYSPEQRIVLSVRPGITDYASIEYINESEILGSSDDPEKTYIEKVIPAKIMLNRRYIDNRNLAEYFRILLLTTKKLLIR